MPLRALVALLLLAAAFSAHAQQYRWLDEKGRVQYTDTPPPPGAKDVRKKKLGAGPDATPAEPYALQVARKNAPVKLYSTPDCGSPCVEARKLLNERGIPFSEVSVTEAAQLEEVKTLSGGTTVPVMLVGDAVQKGYEKSAYNRALDIAGYPEPGVLKARNQAAPPPPKPAAEAAPKPPAEEPAKAVSK